MLDYVLVAIGSALGGVARFWISGAIENRVGQGFPWGTLFVNVTGSFVIGVLSVAIPAQGRGTSAHCMRGLFIAGLCGGYTTFSSFSLQTMHLAQEHRWLLAVGNIAMSLLLCLVFVWLGHTLAENRLSR